MIRNYIQKLLKLFYPLVNRLMPYQVFAYLAVGAANTVLNIALFSILYWTLSGRLALLIWGLRVSSISVELATVISFLITVATGFWLSKHFAFTDAGNEKKEKASQFGRYFLVSAQGQFSDYLITKGLIVFLMVNPVAAYLISTVIMLTITYFLQKYYTFKTRKAI
jgi:putative flippase GtrA